MQLASADLEAGVPVKLIASGSGWRVACLIAARALSDLSSATGCLPGAHLRKLRSETGYGCAAAGSGSSAATHVPHS
jgi:hypothetical protein